MKPEWVTDGARWAERYDRRLAIVVPYRDRLDHLRTFIPHLARYFHADKLDRSIDWRLIVVEQAGSTAFNRGKLKNVGFDLARPFADYVVFHDVDYLPIWADYSFPLRPARLIWGGLTYVEDRDRFFGGAVAFSLDDFQAVNGYSNSYWGWGMEDVELRARCQLLNLSIEHRDGTFQSLAHPSDGFREGALTDEGRATRALWSRRSTALQDLYRHDGLSDLAYKVLDRGSPIRVSGIDYPNAERVLVDIGAPP